jgi:uncharacterized protein YjlB
VAHAYSLISRAASREFVTLKEKFGDLAWHRELYFADDGILPNNPRLPLVLYRSAIPDAGGPDAAGRFERLFRGHGWNGVSVDGVIPKVLIPRQDPIFGLEGPLLTLWR